MKIRLKIFLVMLSMVIIIVAGFAITNTVYLEKFYITNKKEKLVQVGSYILDPNYIVDFRNLEMQNNAEILIKKSEQLKRYSLRKQLTTREVEEIEQAFENNKSIFKIIAFNDYRGRALVLFMPYKSHRYIEIITPLNLIEEGLDTSVKYHFQIIMLAFILGLVAAFIFSKAIVAPILELKEITQKIAKLDFSRKFDKNRTDEIGELGQAINKMRDNLEKNIDEINLANKKLKQDIQKEKEMDKLRKEFVAYVSHELKTPIAIIQGYAQGLMENIATEEDRNFYCEIIVEEAYKMDTLVQELLLMSKIEAGYFKMDTSEIDIYPIIKEIIEKSSSHDEAVVEYSGEKSIKVVCDEKYIDRVLDNFISNAIKYKTGDDKIFLNVDDCGDRYKITVSNETDTLNEEDLENIWTPFIRLKSSIGKEGHGLGLAIIAGILKRHNSDFGVYLSEKNGKKMVNFWFELNKADENFNDEIEGNSDDEK